MLAASYVLGASAGDGDTLRWKKMGKFRSTKIEVMWVKQSLIMGIIH